MHVRAAELLGADLLARRGLHERRAAEKDGAGAAHDHGLVAHRGHVGTTGRARAHDRRELRDARGRHARLVVEDAPEMVAVREDLGLQRQECAARVDEVHAGQLVLGCDLLRAQVLLDRERVVGAALDGGVVGDDHALLAVHDADAGHDARPRRIAVVHAVSGERRELEPGRCPDRAAGRSARAPSACRGRDDARPPPRCRYGHLRAAHATRRPARACAQRSRRIRATPGRSVSRSRSPADLRRYADHA